jgi:hypothetical protein
MTASTQASLDSIKAQACHVGQCETFAELAAILMAERYLKKGRSFDAQRILRSCLRQHPMSPRVIAKLRELSV